MKEFIFIVGLLLPISPCFEDIILDEEELPIEELQKEQIADRSLEFDLTTTGCTPLQ